MHKVNQIQQKLREIAPGTFQKLGDAYLRKKGYNRINSLGSVVGSNKVRKGTPDSFIPLENGFYVFAEHTTTSQKRLFKKINEDLDKCLDEEETGVPTDEIEEIIFCHTGQLKPGEHRTLIEKCKNHDINLNIFGIDEIAYDLFEKYKGLAKDFLGIEVDTGQILSPVDFVTTYGKNQLTTPIDTSFHYRDDEINELIQKLDSNDLVILTGKAGVGKTRLALEACSRFISKHSNYKTLCIYNRFQQDLAEELRVLLSEEGNFLILVDDANRISSFEYFIPYLQDKRDDQNIKIIATVRDYAIDQILDIANQYGAFGQLKIDPFTNEQIRGLVQKEFNIQNSDYLERIQDIAQGNPRLALMAGKIANKHQSLESIRDVSNLYENYFKNIDEDINKLQNPNLLRVAGIVTFYRAVDRSNEDQMKIIKNIWGIDGETFWQISSDLHSMEILDMYETEVVKVSDQVLGTYLFYSAVFKDKIIDFSTLLNEFFPEYRQRFIDALNPVFSAFNDEEITEIMRPDVEKAFEDAQQSNDEDKLLHLMDAFWFLKPIETLSIVKDRIEKETKETVKLNDITFEPAELGNKPSFLKILGRFQGGELDDFRLSIQLVLTYIDKNPSKIPKAIKLFTDVLGFHRYSWRYNYIYQKIIIDELWKKTETGKNFLFSKLFVKVANNYLKTRFRDTRYSGGSSLTFIEFELNPTDKLFELRASVWERIFQLFLEGNESLRDEAFSIIREYSNSGFLVANKETVQEDATHILDFIDAELSSENVSHCLFVHNFLDFLDEKGITFPKFLKQKFTNEIFEIARLLLSDRYQDSETNSYSEFKKVRQQRIKQTIDKYSLNEFKGFFNQCGRINAALKNGHKGFQFRESLLMVLQILIEKDKELGGQVIKYYLKLGNPFELSPLAVSRLILDCYSISDAINMIKDEVAVDQEGWLLGILYSLDEENITDKHLEMLYKLHKTADRLSIPTHLDYVLKFQKWDSKVVPKIIQILLKRLEDDSNFAFTFNIIFNPHTDINKSLIQLFEDDLDILKKAYFAAIDMKDHVDTDGKALKKITDHDPNFVLEYIDYKFNKEEAFSPIDESLNFSFIWLMGNYVDFVAQIAKHIYRWEEVKPGVSGTYFNNFFKTRENDENKEEIINRQDAFLETYIEKYHEDVDLMRYIFRVICNFKTDRRRKFIALFLKLNKKFEDFANLSLEPLQWGFSGSAVPVYQGKIEFLSSLLPLLDSVELIEHRHYLKKRIDGYREQIKDEQKRYFLRDY